MTHSEVWPQVDPGGMRPANWNSNHYCTCGYESKSRVQIWNHVADMNLENRICICGHSIDAHYLTDAIIEKINYACIPCFGRDLGSCKKFRSDDGTIGI